MQQCRRIHDFLVSNEEDEAMEKVQTPVKAEDAQSCGRSCCTQTRDVHK